MIYPQIGRKEVYSRGKILFGSICSGCAVLFVAWAFLRGGISFARDTNIRLEEARELEYYRENGKRVIRGTGHVRLTHNEAELFADEVIVYTESRDVIANGHVIYREKNMSLFADNFIYNADSGVGVLRNAQIFNETAYITGRLVKKTGPDTFEADDASYTTCKSCILRDEPPHWDFRSSRLKATIDGYAYSTNTTFNILDIPVFYFPWFVFPVKTRRQTGFLPPAFLTSATTKKLSLEPGIGFFWAISRSYDATYFYNFITGHGHKSGVELRYEPAKNTSGDMRFFFIDDGGDEWAAQEESTGNHRWAASMRHRQDFSRNLRFRVLGSYLSDQKYLTDFKGDVPGTGEKALKSNAVLVYNTENTITTLENAFYYHMSAPDQRDVSYRFPELNFFSTTSPIVDNLPFYYSFDGTYTYFAKNRNRLRTEEDIIDTGLSWDFGNDGIQDTLDADGSESNGLIDSAESRRGNRIILKPGLCFPVSVFNHFTLESRLTNSNFFYVPHVESYSTRRVPYKNVWDLSLDLSTDLAKIYSAGGSRFKHKMAPEIRYMLRFGEHKRGAHPFFDSFDETGKIQKIAFILDNILFSEKGYQDLFQLTLEQRVNIEYWIRKTAARDRDDEVEAQEKAEIDHVLDPFKGMAKVNFGSIPSFLSAIVGRVEFYYDHYESDINRVSAQLRFSDVRGDSLGLTYTKDTRNSVLFATVGTAEGEASSQTDEDDIHYLKMAASLFLDKNYTISYQNDFSIREKENKRHQEMVGLRYTPDSKCWFLNLRYRVITDGQEDNKIDLGIDLNWGIMQL